MQASAQLLSLIEQVNKHLKPVIIQSNAGNAVLISQSEYLSMIETIDLLSTPANRDWLLESLAQADRGELLTIDIPIQLVKSSPNSAKKKFWIWSGLGDAPAVIDHYSLAGEFFIECLGVATDATEARMLIEF